MDVCVTRRRLDWSRLGDRVGSTIQYHRSRTKVRTAGLSQRPTRGRYVRVDGLMPARLPFLIAVGTLMSFLDMDFGGHRGNNKYRLWRLTTHPCFRARKKNSGIPPLALGVLIGVCAVDNRRRPF